MGVQAYGLICGPLFVPMVLAVSTPGLITLRRRAAGVTNMGTRSKRPQAAKTQDDRNTAKQHLQHQGEPLVSNPLLAQSRIPRPGTPAST